VSIALESIRVRDAMHSGIVTTESDTPLRTVARMMAEHRMHAVAVTDKPNGNRPWGIVSALDVASAVASGVETTAGEAASTQAPTISSDDRLTRAAQLMSERGVGHLIVVDRASGFPIGVLSLLDIAAAYSR
jgi:CBS domain-containing protein